MARFLEKVSNIWKPQTRHKFTCSNESEFVTLSFGDVQLTLHYRDAFDIAAIIRTHAKQAKIFSGDKSTYIHGNGIISDAEENAKRAVPTHL